MKGQYDAGYPGTPDSFHMALERTCRQIEAQKTRRVPKTTVLIAAIIMALLLAGLAYAAVHSRVLEGLFAGATPNPEAQALVKPVAESITKDGITVSFDECVVDGDDWYLGYTISSEREDTVLYTVAWDSSLLLRHKLLDEDGWHMGALGGSVDGVQMPGSTSGTCHQGSFPTYETYPARGEPFTVTLVLRAARPSMELVLWQKPAGNDFADISEKKWKQYKKNRQIPVYENGVTEFPKWITAINDADKLGIMKLSEDAGCVEPFSEITLTATIDPTTAPRQVHMRMAEPQRFELPDRTIEVELVDIMPTRSFLIFSVSPKQWQHESGLSAEEYQARFCRDYDVLNAKGEPILSYRYGVQGYEGELLASKRIRYVSNDPLTEMPEAVTFAPIVWAPQGEGDYDTAPPRQIAGYDMDQAFTVKLDKATKDFRVAIQPLPDVQPVIDWFAGEDAGKLVQSHNERTGDGSYASENYEYVVDWGNGFFYLSKPGAVFPEDTPVDGVPGKHTPAEAEQIAREFLRQYVGIDMDLLASSVVAQNPRAERSGAYSVYFDYRYDGMKIESEYPTQIHVLVNDAGVTYAQGYSLQVVKQ